MTGHPPLPHAACPSRPQALRPPAKRPCPAFCQACPFFATSPSAPTPPSALPIYFAKITAISINFHQHRPTRPIVVYRTRPINSSLHRLLMSSRCHDDDNSCMVTCHTAKLVGIADMEFARKLICVVVTRCHDDDSYGDVSWPMARASASIGLRVTIMVAMAT